MRLKIAAVTKFKHGLIWQLLKKLGWTQAELARRSGVHVTLVGQYVNLRLRPNLDHAQAIQRAFGEVGEFLNLEEAWPEDFVGTRHAITCEQISDIDPRHILTGSEELMLEADKEALHEIVTTTFSDLPHKRRKILEARFFEGKTLGEISEATGFSSERIRQIQNKALRTLRHPVRAKLMEEFSNLGHIRASEAIDVDVFEDRETEQEPEQNPLQPSKE